MRLRALAVASATGLVVALAPTSAFAAKPAYKVSITISKSTADVGQTVRIAGKVAGPKAAGKRLVIQRKVGAGAWSTVRKVTTTNSARYATSLTVTTAGAQQYRVVAPKSKLRRAGTSGTRTLTGWRWIDMTTNGAPDDLTRSTVTIDGRKYANAMATAPSSSGLLFAATGKACDTLTFSLGMEGTITDTAHAEVYQVDRLDSPTFGPGGGKYVSGGQAPASSRWSVKLATAFVVIGLDADGADRAALIAPRLHCSVNSLPRTAGPTAA